MSMLIRQAQGVDVISLSGKIMGGEDTDEFRQEIRNRIRAGHRQFLVDLHGVEWVNSMGLGAMVGAYVTVNQSGGRIAFAGIDSVRRLLLQTRLYEIFDCYESKDEGLASFAATAFG